MAETMHGVSSTVCQCAEECLTYEADDRSTVDEITEWLGEIVEDIRAHAGGVESLLDDIIPVKPSPLKTSGGTLLGRNKTARPSKSPSPTKSPHDKLLESIRNHNTTRRILRRKRISRRKFNKADESIPAAKEEPEHTHSERNRGTRHDASATVPPRSGTAPGLARQ